MDYSARYDLGDEMGGRRKGLASGGDVAGSIPASSACSKIFNVSSSWCHGWGEDNQLKEIIMTERIETQEIIIEAVALTCACGASFPKGSGAVSNGHEFCGEDCEKYEQSEAFGSDRSKMRRGRRAEVLSDSVMALLRQRAAAAA